MWSAPTPVTVEGDQVMRRVQPNGPRWLGFCCLGFLAAVACAFGQSSSDPTGSSSPSGESPGRVTSRLCTLSRLGPEHLANAVYRRGAEGNSYIVAWGDRLLQWPLAKNGAMREVYPREGDWQYNNGGCAWDVDRDGVDEIVTGRGPGGTEGTPDSTNWSGSTRWKAGANSGCIRSHVWTSSSGRPHMISSRWRSK